MQEVEGERRYTITTAVSLPARAVVETRRGRSPKAPAVTEGTIQDGCALAGHGRIVGTMRRGEAPTTIGNGGHRRHRPDHSGAVRKGSAADAWGLKRTRRAREAEAARWGKGEGDAHGSRSTNQSAPAARISTPPSTSGSAAPCFTARAMQTTAEAARASGAISSAPQHQAGEARREEASAGRSGRTTIRAAEAGRMLPLGNACGEGGEVEGGRAAHRPAPNACQVGARLATIRPPRTCAS